MFQRTIVMKTARITLVVPVYNRALHLPKLFRSIVAQTYRPLDIILVDNASTDESAQVCEAFRVDNASGDMRIRVVSEKKAGAACARNKGLALCATPYVYFFDSDDELSPDFFAVMEAFLEKNDVDEIALRTRMIVQGRTVIRSRSRSRNATAHILNSMYSTVSLVHRTAFLRRIGGWNEELRTWDDWELGVRVALAAPRMKWIRHAPFHTIHVHGDSLTNTGFSATLPWVLRAMDAARNDVRQYSSSPVKRRRGERALFLRMSLLAGKLHAEGYEMAAHACWSATLREYAPGRLLRLWGRLLMEYTSRGGRGAWRLAFWSV